MSWHEYLEHEIDADRQAAGGKTVLYLEGKTDLPMLFSLLGVTIRSDEVHEGVLAKALTDSRGGGSTDVKQRLTISQRLGFKNFVGIVDGDGEPFDRLRESFDGVGPLFRWPSYCIENLLAIAGWPSGWGNGPPDWSAVLHEYAPLAAQRRMHTRLEQELRGLSFRRTKNPSTGSPAPSALGIEEDLREDQESIRNGVDLCAVFREEFEVLTSAIERDPREGHAHINGKWFVTHLAPRLTGRSEEHCRDEWASHVTSIGGLSEVKDWWSRITRRPR